MKLEQQVSSLELSKRLKELGVKRESLFHYASIMDLNTDIEPYKVFDTGKIALKMGEPNEKYQFLYSAFTVAELGEMLPEQCISLIMEDWEKNPERKYKCYDSTVENWTMVDRQVYASTEADARAKMLIYLLENKLLIL